MNYIKHLSGFFNKVSVDDRLNPTHVSLYVSLFQFWNACRFHNPISISRQEAMNVSKISSKVTYHKCIRELHQFGYLRYEPSYNPFKGSLVYLFDFQTGTELVNKISQTKIETSTVLVANGYHTKIETGTGQALIPYINNSNNTKQKTIVNAITKNKSDEKFKNSKPSGDQLELGTTKKKKLREKKESESSFVQDGNDNEEGFAIFKNSSGFIRPLRNEAKTYFAQNKWPDKEADKFYNHYESNGWMIGKTPMANWKAAGDNWMLNSENFKYDKAKNNLPEHRAGKLNTSTGKAYDEPL